MNLYAWHPYGQGALSFFVMAESEKDAIEIVTKEIERRCKLDFRDREHIYPGEVARWGQLTTH